MLYIFFHGQTLDIRTIIFKSNDQDWSNFKQKPKSKDVLQKTLTVKTLHNEGTKWVLERLGTEKLNFWVFILRDCYCSHRSILLVKEIYLSNYEKYFCDKFHQMQSIY